MMACAMCGIPADNQLCDFCDRDVTEFEIWAVESGADREADFERRYDELFAQWLREQQSEDDDAFADEGADDQQRRKEGAVFGDWRDLDPGWLELDPGLDDIPF